MAEFLLELFSEEIPARMQVKAADDLARLVTSALKDKGLEFGAVASHSTPRRLTLVINDLSVAQPDKSEERRGPRVGAPEKALEGFLRSTGLTQEQLEERETPKGAFYYAVIETKGGKTADVLAEILPAALSNLPWPKPMKWSDHTARWVRPLHSILCLFDGETLPFSWEHLTSSNQTFGHRFMAPDAITVTGFDDYKAKLRSAFVVLEHDERKSIIAKDAERLAASEDVKLIEDQGLLAEVAGLVEWPESLIGRVDPQFMDVPQEALISAMRSHQKYFSLSDDSGKMAPYFITVANLRAEDGGKKITAGNERVLSARLSDAKFFWDQDRKGRLEDRLDPLDKVVFHARLGTVREKISRIVALSEAIAPFVAGADVEDCKRAALLCKADLTTEMVGEFADLQGLMGRYYAEHDGEKPSVAKALQEHYSPLGPSDTCPSDPVSVVVALADKIDTLVGFFAMDEKPTGSKDPYALRRAALGVIRLVLENGLRLPLVKIFKTADELQIIDEKLNAEELLDFFADRLKVHLKEKNVRHDYVAAIFALGGTSDLVRLMAQVDALSSFLDSDDGANLLVAYRRAANILRIEEKKDDASYDQQPDAALMAESQETALFNRIEEVLPMLGAALGNDEFDVAFKAAATLRKPVDDFFDDVIVNADDANVRVNRLRLLSSIRNALDQLADLSKIEG
ncbi:glycine--tRNA ligase subunit beta [Sneathiella sp. P13V-1]|uniref:glycine--tRNA ligase subunit beta n=1 Tax=Sneathiella sp. P13V-1 TaxID=2697366 RepID=UPI00187B75E0|nr:glycine--tRNA ligase subunit beta [Sneathiella sp. P13V-1]MBE7637895.1 glycine--tRNA ligase subunit beta [Sneathiella sp. P13V-1]